jgi:hypothetical protein
MNEENGITEDYLPMDPKRLLQRIHTALNTRDVQNLLLCLQVDYEKWEPARQEKPTIGLESVRQSWEELFKKYPDFKADLVRSAIDSTTIWTEWHWYNDDEQGARALDQIGVIIFGVEDGLVAWSRWYMLDRQKP